MEFHRWIAKQNPRAANVVVGGFGLGINHHLPNGLVRPQGKFVQERQVHRYLRRLVGETGRGPYGNGTAVWRENQCFGQALLVDILKESVQTVDQEVDRQASAVGQSSRMAVVEEVR